MWCKITSWQHRGFTDVGLGVHRQKELDALPPTSGRNRFGDLITSADLQLAYELGRTQAVAMKREWGVVETWKRDETFTTFIKRVLVIDGQPDFQATMGVLQDHLDFLNMKNNKRKDQP